MAPIAETRRMLEGGCHCGAITLAFSTARVPADTAPRACDCSFCRAHGAAFVTWAGFPEAQVRIDDPEGRLHWYESSPGARRGSCARCGTPMLFTAERWPGEMHVARALLDDALQQLPAAHVFYETHVPWLEVADGLPKKCSTA